jgi:tetratricopeptide (TPR) repeat protein
MDEHSIYKSEGNLNGAIELYKKALTIEPNDDLVKRNLNNTAKVFEKQEQEANLRTVLDSGFKSALKALKSENNFVIDKLSKFIFNLKQEDGFSDWKIAI